jgi:hypothetical protein
MQDRPDGKRNWIVGTPARRDPRHRALSWRPQKAQSASDRPSPHSHGAQRKTQG